ncbi:hypothetical protein STENM327S_04022 [Streptomyces tendae]
MWAVDGTWERVFTALMAQADANENLNWAVSVDSRSCGPTSTQLGPEGYQGAGGTVRVPYRGRWETLSAGQQAVNRSHAKFRALVEQAVATLKSWRLLRRLRCSTTRITVLVQAVLCLHQASSA